MLEAIFEETGKCQQILDKDLAAKPHDGHCGTFDFGLRILHTGGLLIAQLRNIELMEFFFLIICVFSQEYFF